MKYLKPYNESIRHLLKNTKTEDEIRKNMKKTYTPQGKKVMAAEHDLVWLLDETIKEGGGTTDLGYIFNIAIDYDSLNIIKYLIDEHELKFKDYHLYRAIKNNNLELVKMIFDSGHIENVDIDECIKYYNGGNINISLYLYGKKYVNESIKHLLKPKSKEDILKSLENLSDLDKIKKIIRYNLPFSLLPENLIVDGDLNFSSCQLTQLPDNLIVNGELSCRDNRIRKLPDNLIVNGDFDISDNPISELPKDLIVNGHLFCRYTLVPKDIKKPEGVKGNLYI